EIESAVTPGADAVRPVCFAVSLVQNAVFDVNGDEAGSAATFATAVFALEAGAGFCLPQASPPPPPPQPTSASVSVNVNNPTGTYRARMVTPCVTRTARPVASHDARGATSA